MWNIYVEFGCTEILKNKGTADIKRVAVLVALY